jgi:hypothetical protein
MRLAERTIRTARLHPALRCDCGHVARGCDLNLNGMYLQLVCANCHQTLFEFKVSVIDDGGETW